MESSLRVCIVTPCFNAARFIDDTISSIVTQNRNFTLDYHVQDGGSTDGTLQKLKEWSHRLADFPFDRDEPPIRFSYDSEHDRGMYDAINKGFRHLQPGDNDIMSWVNADDVLCTGALSFVAQRFAEFPDIALLGGRAYRVSETGVPDIMFRLSYFPRITLQSGLHEGRHLVFVPQEGTFWRGWLWHEVGGVRDDLRLAGDFDLWRRFARYADYVSVDMPLCQRRVHPSQLSHQLAKYYEEVDGLFSTAERQQTELLYNDEFLPWIKKNSSHKKGKFCGTELYCEVWPGKAPKWALAERPYGSTRIENIAFPVSAGESYLPNRTDLMSKRKFSTFWRRRS